MLDLVPVLLEEGVGDQVQNSPALEDILLHGVDEFASKQDQHGKLEQKEGKEDDFCDLLIGRDVVAEGAADHVH